MEIVVSYNGESHSYKVKSGMILEYKNPVNDENFLKVISLGNVKSNGDQYLCCVRSRYPDVFPEFAASPPRNGDIGFTIKNGDTTMFKLIKLPINWD